MSFHTPDSTLIGNLLAIADRQPVAKVTAHKSHACHIRKKTRVPWGLNPLQREGRKRESLTNFVNRVPGSGDIPI
jgi:hypothetical protein